MMGRRYRESYGPKFSEAARLLWVRKERDGLSIEDMTRALGLPRGMSSRLLWGDRRASIKTAIVCHRVYGIPIAAWEQEPKAPHIEAPSGEVTRTVKRGNGLRGQRPTRAA